MLNAIMAKRKNLSFPPPGAPGNGAAEDRPGDGGGRWLYGLHAVLAALANPRRRCRRLVVAAPAGRDLEGRLDDAAGGSGVARPAPETLERREVERLLPGGAVHQGLALLADDLPRTSLEAFCRQGGGSPAVVLDQATDPRNVGAVLRAAAAFGAGAVVVHARGSPQATGALAKAASGALEKVPLVRAANIVRAMEALKDAGYWCLGLDAGAAATIAEAGVSGRLALVLGSEGGGLRRLTRQTCDLVARIPTTDRMDSLNLSTAAAIALYQLARPDD